MILEIVLSYPLKDPGFFTNIRSALNSVILLYTPLLIVRVLTVSTMIAGEVVNIEELRVSLSRVTDLTLAMFKRALVESPIKLEVIS